MRTIRELRRASVVLGRPGLSGDGINAAEKAQIIQNTNVLAALRFDPSHPTYGAVRGSVSTAQRTANRAAIQLAADDARATGGTLVLKGEYEIDATVHLQCHVDAHDGVISVFSTTINPAVLVGSVASGTRLMNRSLALPTIIQRAKSGTGWAGSDTGLVISNVYSSAISIPHVWNFSNGVRFTANGTGNVYNEVTLGFLENNKVGLAITTENGTGWTNEINWYGGRFQINSAEGTNISGARHIIIRNNAYQNNNHIFHKPSVEGSGPEYHIDSDGAYITIVQGRYEASPPRVRLGPNSTGHLFEQGWGLQNVVFTIESGGGANTTVRHRGGMRLHAGGSTAGVMALTNQSSSNNPALTIMEASVPLTGDPATMHAVAIGAFYSIYKRQSDATPRLQVAHQTGLLEWGDGATGLDVSLGRYGGHGLRVDKKMLAAEGFGSGGYTAGAPAGSPKGSIPIYSDTGALLGRLAVY